MVVPRALQEIVGVAGFVGDGARDFARRLPAEVGILSVFQMTIVFRLMIENVHFAALVEPQATDDDVVHRRRHFPPRVMVAAPFEAQVRDALDSGEEWLVGKRGWNREDIQLRKKIKKKRRIANCSFEHLRICKN